jgi:hypothetical protein
MPEQFFMKLGMYVMAPEPILTEYFTNLWLYVYHSIIVANDPVKNLPQQ